MALTSGLRRLAYQTKNQRLARLEILVRGERQRTSRMDRLNSLIQKQRTQERRQTEIERLRSIGRPRVPTQITQAMIDQQDRERAAQRPRSVPTIDRTLADRQQAGRLLDRAGYGTTVPMTPEERQRLIQAPEGTAQALIQQGNVGPVTDIGQRHRGGLFDEEPLPGVAGKILGGPSMAIPTIATAGLGTFSSLPVRAGVALGGTVAPPYAAEEAAKIDPRLALPAGLAAGVVGALAGGGIAGLAERGAGAYTRAAARNVPDAIAAGRANPELGGTRIPGGEGAIDQVAKRWTKTYGDAQQITETSRGLIDNPASFDPQNPAHVDAARLLNAIDAAPYSATPEPLYRYIRVPKGRVDETLARYAVGAEVDEPIIATTRSSFSPAAAHFGRPVRGHQAIRFRIKGAQSIDVSPFSKHPREFESLTSGRFRVTNIGKGTFKGNEVVLVDMEAVPTPRLSGDSLSQATNDLGQPRLPTTQSTSVADNFAGDVGDVRMGEPPVEPPAGGPPELPPPDPFETGMEKLKAGIQTTRVLRRETTAARRLETAARARRYEELLQENLAAGAPPSEAIQRARAALAGEKATFTGPEFGLTEQENSAFWKKLFDWEGGTYDRNNAGEALIRIANNEPLRPFEIKLLSKVYGAEFAALLKKARYKKGLWDHIANSITIPRAVKTAFDASYPFRQGALTSIRHNKEFFGNFGPMMRAYVSDESAETLNAALRNNTDQVKILNPAGIEEPRTLGEIHDAMDILRPLPDEQRSFLEAEEAFMSETATHIPVLGKAIRASQRAFTLYGNKLRSDIADYWLRHWAKNGTPITTERLHDLGALLNRLTGRGTLGDNAVANTVRVLGWAPLYRVSGPEAVAQMFHRDPAIRNIAIQNVASFVGGGLALLGAAKLSGAADVSMDPRSADFGKMRFGDVRVNIWGANQVLARTLAQALTGKRTDYLTGESSIKWTRPLVQYLRSGASPELGIAADLISGRDFVGNKLGWDAKTLKTYGVSQILPLVMKDLWDAYQQGGPVAAGALAAPLFFGVSASSYETPAQKKARAYNKLVEQGAFGPDAKLYADEDPTIRNLNISRTPDLQDISKPSESKEQIEQSRAELEIESGLGAQDGNPGLAAEFLSGNTAVGPAIIDAADDLQKQMNGVFKATYIDSGEIKASSTDGETLDQLRSLNPKQAPYMDFTTGEIDYDQYDADEAQLLGKLSAPVRKAYETFISQAVDPDWKQLEPQVRKARDLRSDYYDLPRWSPGIQNQDKIEEIHKGIQAIKVEFADRGATEVPSEVVYREFASRHPEYDARTISRAYVLRSGSKASTELTNPARFQFLSSNADILKPFFPDLYTLGVRAEMAPAGAR